MSFTPGQKILFLASVAAITSLGLDMTLTAIPGIEADLGVQTGLGTLSSSSFVAGFAVTPMLGGPLSDCFGRTRVLIISLGCFAVMAFACASAQSLHAFLFFRLLQGCASGIATTLPLAMVRDLWEGSAARQSMSEVATLSSLMPVVAPALGSLAVRFGGWRLLFAGQALFGGAVAAAAAWFPESLPLTLRQPLDLRRQLQNIHVLVSEPKLRMCALVYGLLFACTFSFTAVSPLILIQRLGMHRDTYALVFAINALGSLLGAAASTFLSKRNFEARVIIQSGLYLAAGSTFVAFFLLELAVPIKFALLPAVFIALFGFNLAGPSLLVEALQSVPRLLGSGSGMIRCVFMLLNFAASSMLAVFCARHMQYTEKATSLLMVTLAALAVWLYSKSSPEASLLLKIQEPDGNGGWVEPS